MWQNQIDNSMSDQGGGFMKSPITPSQATQGGKGKKFRAQNLVPMTISQINSSLEENEVLQIGSMEVHVVIIVGLVRSIDQHMTHIVYDIDDMSGPWMKIQHWFDDESDHLDDSKKPMVLNTYVKVIGTVKSVRGENHIVVLNIRPITDLNELTLHYLQVMQANSPLPMARTEPDLSGPMDVDAKSEIAPQSNVNQMYSTDVSGLTQIQQLVYKIILDFDSMTGCPIEKVYNRLTTTSPVQIKEALKFLNDEGHIYSTVDDSHFKITDGVM